MASPEPLQPYRKVQSDAEKELLRILEQTARAIRARVSRLPVGIGGDVRRAQLTATLGAIKRMQRSMWTGGVAPLVMHGVDDAEKAAESAIETMTRVAYASLPDAAAESLVRGLRLSAESGLKSDKARRRRELSARVYRQAALNEGKIEDLIREGLIANLSAKELAASVYEHVSPTAKGGSSYAAMRLARTEINNAFHERQLQGASRPGVTAVKWNLSGSHRVPDLCNVYASHGGNGHWEPDAVPEKPHPNCFCYLTYITAPPEEFRKRLAAGSFDDEIDRRVRERMAEQGQKVGSAKPPSTMPEPIRTVISDILDFQGEVLPSVIANIAKRNKVTKAKVQEWIDEIKGSEKKKSPVKAVPALPKVRTGEGAHEVVPKGLFKRGSMTPDQRKALKTYESGWFTVINGFLRSDRWGESDYREEERDVNRIDAAMNESVLPEPIQGWRGLFNARKLFKDDLDNDLTGFTWEEKGYGSMTTNEDITRLFLTGTLDKNAKPVDDSVKMVVNVDAGVKALETSTHTKGSKANGPQAEITLQHDLIWKVTKDNGKDDEGVRHLEITVSPRVDRPGTGGGTTESGAPVPNSAPTPVEAPNPPVPTPNLTPRDEEDDDAFWDAIAKRQDEVKNNPPPAPPRPARVVKPKVPEGSEPWRIPGGRVEAPSGPMSDIVRDFTYTFDGIKSRKLKERLIRVGSIQETHVGNRLNRISRVKMGVAEGYRGANATYTYNEREIGISSGLEGRAVSESKCRCSSRKVRGGDDPIETTLAHEMGHAFIDLNRISPAMLQTLVDHIAGAVGIDRIDVSKLPFNSFKQRDEALTRWLQSAKNRPKFTKAVSYYATSNIDEFFAEVWADFTMNPNPSDTIKSIGDMMKEFIKGDRKGLFA